MYCYFIGVRMPYGHYLIRLIFMCRVIAPFQVPGVLIVYFKSTPLCVLAILSSPVVPGPKGRINKVI